MTNIERRLCAAGLALFLLALLQGFFIPLFARVDAARAAHATALGSGTFLIAVGLLWPKLAFGARAAASWSAALAVSLYAIAFGLTLASAYPADDAAHPIARATAMALNAGGAGVLIAAVVAAWVACRSTGNLERAAVGNWTGADGSTKEKAHAEPNTSR